MGREVDNVSHPPHYADSCSIECIDAMLIAFGYENTIKFCTMNAYKYIWRHKNKNGFEDVKKALWYLDKADELSKFYYHCSADTEDEYKALHFLALKIHKEYIVEKEEYESNNKEYIPEYLL